jgi:hypothetical protein
MNEEITHMTRIETFLYVLMHSKVPVGEVRNIIEHVTRPLQTGFVPDKDLQSLAQLSREFAERLREPNVIRTTMNLSQFVMSQGINE